MDPGVLVSSERSWLRNLFVESNTSARGYSKQLVHQEFIFILGNEYSYSTKSELAIAAACRVFVAATELHLPDRSISLVEPVGHIFASIS